MMPPAPGGVFTSTVWAKVFPPRSPSSRAMVSVGPPAENGTTIVIGVLGKPCPHAAPVTSASSAMHRNLIDSSFLVAAKADRGIALDLVHQRDFPAEIVARVLLVVRGVIIGLVPDVVARRGRTL